MSSLLPPMSAALLLAVPGAALAQSQTPSSTAVTEVDEVEVIGRRAGEPTGPQFTAPLLDTPKSVTVISRELIEQRGAASLADVLRTTPGISLGLGEGGTPVGDRPFIRGYEASTDIFIDGVRDLGRFAHEAFNIEQVEIIKGPGSAYSGRGSTGGSINMVSKRPRPDNFLSGSIGAGTDQYMRGTLDMNRMITDRFAVRLNLMSHHADTPGRDHVNAERYGLAPSLAYRLSDSTSIHLGYYMLRADDVPDLGHPFAIDGSGQPVKVRRDNFYGVVGRDARRNNADIGTLTLEHEFPNGFQLTNVSRLAESTSQYIMSRPTIHVASGMVNRDVRTGNRRSETWANQTALRGAFNVAGVRNQFVAGLDFAQEKLLTGDVPASALFAVGRTDLTKPNASDPAYRGPTLADFSDDYDALSNRTRTQAAYVFNTMDLTDKWSLNLGLRYDDYDVTDGSVSNRSKFWNYQAGLVYKPRENGSIYLSYGTSSNPSGETAGQSGGADGSAGGGLGGSRPNLDPEENRSFELGTKWEVLNNRLSLTAAVFEAEKTNQRATDPTTGEVALIGTTARAVWNWASRAM
ncbi:TonB-dependent receptor [Brevundimonas diminuta]|uniref:TonB-dependent receptor n=1 Tax=Brevundimonas diminuta TaxID=293 RepID=UPI00320B4A84